MTQTTAPKTYGPKQARTAKAHAEGIWLWSLDLMKAVEAGDLDKVAKLTTVIATTNDNLAQLTTRAAR